MAHKTTKKMKEIPWISVRKRTVLTDRPPRPAKLVPTFADRGYCVVSVADPPGRLSRCPRPELLLFLPSSSSVILTRLSSSCLRKSGTAGNRIRDLWVCRQEL
jgi:hypothetical protein